MIEKDIGLDRLCILYEELDDSSKEKVVLMTEGLLNSQNIIPELRIKEETEFKEETA